MKINFIIIFLLAMVLILLSTTVTTYTAIRDSQKSFEKELTFLKESISNNSEFQKRISLYKAFAEKQAIDTTRRVLGVFFLELLIMVALFLIFIYGVTLPINKLSSAVKSIYFEKTENDLLLEEAGTEEVRVLVRAFNEMVIKLKNYEKILGNVQKYRGWKEISRIIVHEINNIISPVQTYMEFLIDKVEEKEKVFFILTKLNDMKSVLQKFREISHLPDALLEMQNIVPIVREIGKEFKNVFFSTNDTEEVLIKIDRVLFKEIIRNLIKNAVESCENVSVEVGIKEENKQTFVFIKDNGKGMSKETLAKIFEPGFSTKKGNIGIGLSIVKSLAQEQNARVEVDSTVNNGTCFKIIFES